MEVVEIVSTVAFMAVFALSLWGARGRRRPIDEGRGALARELGLEYRPGDAQLHGVLDGFELSIRWLSGEDSSTDRTEYKLLDLPGIRMSAPANAGRGPGEWVDVDFQADSLTTAIFRAPEVRALANAVLSFGAKMDGDALLARVPGHDSTKTTRLRLDQTVDLARAVRARRRQGVAFLAEALEQPWAGSAILRTMIARYPTAPETIAAGQRLQTTTNEEMQILAAIARKASGDVRAHALDRKRPMEQRIEALESLLLSSPELVDREFQSWFLRMLDREELQMRRLAVRGLAFAGTVDAVPKLRELADQFFLDGQLKRGASAAIATIQARSSGAVGQLTIVTDSSAGALSEAHGHGAVSIPNGED